MVTPSSYTSLPDVPDAFAWSAEAWGAGLRCAPLQALTPHVFSTRHLSLSSHHGPAWLEAAVASRTVASVRQVHGRHVVVVRDGTGPDPGVEADVLVSSDTDIAVSVRAADCVPLLMADRARGVVAAVHAGWRGTAASAAVAGVEALGREFGSRAADLVAAIGPCIGACCYEVGPELVDAFAAAGHERHLIDRWFVSLPPPRGSRARGPLHLDVAGANRDQLLLAGVPPDQIHVAGLCTAMHLDVLTSYRAEKEKAGRLVAAIRATT